MRSRVDDDEYELLNENWRKPTLDNKYGNTIFESDGCCQSVIRVLSNEAKYGMLSYSFCIKKTER